MKMKVLGNIILARPVYIPLPKNVRQLFDTIRQLPRPIIERIITTSEDWDESLDNIYFEEFKNVLLTYFKENYDLTLYPDEVDYTSILWNTYDNYMVHPLYDNYVYVVKPDDLTFWVTQTVDINLSYLKDDYKNKNIKSIEHIDSLALDASQYSLAQTFADTNNQVLRFDVEIIEDAKTFDINAWW